MIPKHSWVQPYPIRQTITWWSVKEAKPCKPDYYITVDKWGDGPLMSYWDGDTWRYGEGGKEEPVCFWTELSVPEDIMMELESGVIEEAIHEA